MYDIRPNSFVYTVTITEESEYLTDPMTIPRVFICINPFILTTKILKIPVGHITAQNIITKMYSDKQALEKKYNIFAQYLLQTICQFKKVPYICTRN
jgi:hypothetical protein